jgi:hypothetical protein
MLEVVNCARAYASKGLGCFGYSNLEFSLKPITGHSRVYITKMVLRYSS